MIFPVEQKLVEPRILLVKGCAGLGNRLLTLESGLSYAEKTGRRIVVDWRDGRYGSLNRNCFSDVFSVDSISDLSLLEELNNPSIYPSSWPTDKLHMPIYSLFKPADGPFGLSQSKFIPLGRLRLIYHLWSFTGSRTSHRPLSFIEYVCAMLRKSSFPFGSDLASNLEEDIVVFADFLPSVKLSRLKTKLYLRPEIQDGFERLSSEIRHNLDGRLIGVHVRATDLQPIVDICVLFKRLRSELSLKDAIFLATDNPQIVDCFEREFPSQLRRQKIFFPENYKAGIHRDYDQPDEKKMLLLREAILDLWMLRSSDVLFYQGSSSFSRIAAHMGCHRSSYDWETLSA